MPTSRGRRDNHPKWQRVEYSLAQMREKLSRSRVLREAFFLRAKFGGMGLEAACGGAQGMLLP